MASLNIPNWAAFYSSKTGYRLVWISIYALSLALASSIFFYDIPLPENRITLSQLEFIAAADEYPDTLPASHWAAVTLPDNWSKRNRHDTNLWYRGHINLDKPPDDLWAVLIPALKMNAAVFLNGKLLGSGGRFTDPVARNWMTPLLFTIPGSLLQRGDNTFHIRVKSDPAGTGKLAALQIGEYEGLNQAHHIHYLFRITSIQIISTMLLMMGGLMAMLWLTRRQESYYGYYALAVSIWGLHNFNIFIIHIPFSTRFWDWLAYVSIGYYTFFAMIFTHRFLGRYHPRIEYSVIISGIIISLALLILEDEWFYSTVNLFWYPAVFSLGFYIFTYTSIEAWRRRSIELQFLTATGGTTLLFAMHDLLVMHDYLDWQDGYYIQYSAAVLLTLFSFILLRRFAYSLNQVDTLNQNLERRVEDKRVQLEENFQRLRHMESDRVRADERERLARDIHDGMGGHLVSTLAMIESGQASIASISSALKDSLNDLRLMIDSMDIEEDDLTSLLGMFRLRIGPRLKNSHITLEWKVEDIPAISGFGPREALNILRILQESITNTIKHAQADHIQLATYAYQQDQKTHVMIEIKDNGNGFSDERATGNGLRNMQQRANKSGYKLSIYSDNTGTKISISLNTQADT